MRLPLRHPPPVHDPALRRCAHLEELAAAAIGLPLRAAAECLSSARSRGRHGNALQWHLGLDFHDAVAELDWENRIEIKLVSVWQTADGRVACDKLKVCDLAISPWDKLANVLFVFADRMTRVVVGGAFFHLGGSARSRLAACWDVDPHFDEPSLFVEAREQRGRSAPAYYLSHRWFGDEALLPAPGPEILVPDRRWWNRVRAEFGRDPMPALAEPDRGERPCPRCGGPLRFDPEHLAAWGWAPAWHGMPLGERCAVAGHFVVRPSCVPRSPVASFEEFAAAFELRCDAASLWRLADRVPEPEDHQHGYE